MRRYYPGFLAATFLILLRIAIGWHFLYEGIEKYQSTQRGKSAFSAEIYLRNANGPLGPYFRHMLPDVDGRNLLDLAKLKEKWRADVNAIADYFGFDDSQRKAASAQVDQAERWADGWFSELENKENRQKYLDALDVLEATEVNPKSMSFERERASEARRSLDAERRELIGPINSRGKDLRDAVSRLATDEQADSAGAPLISRIAPHPSVALEKDKPTLANYALPWSQLDWINFTTTWGLIAIGLCLILGLLTPMAALGAALFLAMIYFSMPPWPGMPENPKAEGHYFIVSKNLIELIACLLIAVTPSGHWIGLDALVLGGRERRRARAAAETPANEQPAPVAGGAPETNTSRPTRGDDEANHAPIPLS